MVSGQDLLFQPNGWRVELDTTWDVLGPSPTHAREQHFISPSFPLNLSQPIDYEERWPSAYATGGTIKWSKENSTPDGNIEISFPETRWESLRATEGWAALQHHALLRSTLIIYPPTSSSKADIPNLLVDLRQASYFTLRPKDFDPSTFVPQWFAGNIYDLERALPHIASLPTTPSTTEPTEYDLFISGDYEIRLFGDPHVGSSEIPVQKISVRIAVQEIYPQIVHQQSQDVLCDFLDGYAFGKAIGIGIQSSLGWWGVESVTLTNPTTGMNIKLPDTQTVIAPLQTRTMPLFLEQSAPFMGEKIEFDIVLKSASQIETLALSIPITQKKLSSLKGLPLQGTFILAGTSTGTFLAIPPALGNDVQNPPLVALHGAGVDILSHDFWTKSLPVSESSWVIAPTGRTSWGLDWHGSSTNDVWSALDSLAALMHCQGFGFPRSWIFPKDTQIVLIGHSNGGQGTWHIASRFPDRILAAIPAAGYIKSQAYVPLTLARSGHFIDPALRSILETSLILDDNDLHVTNLVDTPMLVIHGGSDENVPVWHSRELVGTLKAWHASANVTYLEDAGGGHWYPTILKRPEVETFIAKIFTDEPVAQSEAFTLTVTNPRDSGSLHGWTVEQLLIPGRLARLRVLRINQSKFSIELSNVHTFGIPSQNTPYEIYIDDQILPVLNFQTQTRIHRVGPGQWRVIDSSIMPQRVQPPGRIQAVLSTPGPFTIIVPSALATHELSVAQRLAHILQLYHKIDSDMLPEQNIIEQMKHGIWPSGNVVAIARPTSPLVQEILAKKQTSVGITDGVFHVGWKHFSKPDQAILFTHPHPTQGNSKSFILFILFNDIPGLERAARLFPFRTGVAVPDWLVVDGRMDNFGAGGIQAAGVWDADWKLSEAMSWI